MSIFDPAANVSVGPGWRCPHCRTLQPQATTCRTCGRSSTSCRSCLQFRSSVAGDIGYCADDPGRTPLNGDEVRSCWVDPGRAPDGALPGLFDELPAAASRSPLAPTAGSTPPAARPRDVSQPPPSRLGVPRERPDAAATGSRPYPAGLVEAPHVAPGRRLVTELRRRTGQRPPR